MDWWKRYDDLARRVVPILGGTSGIIFLLTFVRPGDAFVTMGPVSVDAFYSGLVAFSCWICVGIYNLLEKEKYDHLP